MPIAKHTRPAKLTRLFATLAGATIASLVVGCAAVTGEKKDDGFTTSGNREADQRADQYMAKDAQLKGGAEKEKTLSNTVNPDNKTGPNGVAKADAKKTLYDRLGGDAGLTLIVDDFTARALADPRVNWQRKGVKQGGLGLNRGRSVEWQTTPENVARLKKHMVQFFALSTGGPTVYEGKDMKTSHAGMHITNAEFDASVGDLKATLDKLQIPNQEQKELLAVVESTRPQIAEPQ